MLNNLKIRNYRLFKDFEITDLANVNLIVGENNSGKSSLLEAIHLLMGDDVRASLLHLLHERGEYALKALDPRVDRYSRGAYQISHIFHNHEQKSSQVIKIFSDSKEFLEIALQNSRENRIQKSLPIGDESEVLNDEAGYLGFKHFRLGQQVTLPLDEDGLLPSRVVRYHRYQSAHTMLVTTNYLGYDEIAVLWDSIQLTPKEEKVVAALKILDPNVNRIGFTNSKTSNSGILLQLKRQDKPIPLGSMGDGMRRILAIIASLANVENGGVLLVDEIDTGLHYAALKDMWKLLIEMARKQGVQVFATTHSGDCIKAFKQMLDETDNSNIGKLFRLDRMGEEVKAVSYSVDELSVAVEQGIEVR